MNRRSFLKAAGIGGVVLVGGGAFLFEKLRGFGPPAPGCKILDVQEMALVDSLAETFFPGPPDWSVTWKQAGVPQFVDTYVAGLYEDTQGLFRTLVRGFELAPVAGRWARFTTLPLADRQQIVDEWRTSSSRLKRAGFQSLSLAIKLGYYEHDDVRAAAGLTFGCDLKAHPGYQRSL